MTQYIDKEKLVAEIEKELNTTKKYSTEYVNGKKYALKKILSFLDTLEVKQDTVHGTVDYPLIGCDFPNIYPNYKELKEYCDRNGIKDNDKVKLVIIKDM